MSNDSNRESETLTDDGVVTAEDLERQIEQRRHDLQKQLAQWHVSDGLTASQDQRLVTMVARLSASLSWRQRYPDADKEIRVENKSGVSQRRIFRKRVEIALDAVDAALNYATRLSQRNKLFGRSVVNLAVPRLKAAHVTLKNLRDDMEIFGNFKRPGELTAAGRTLFTDQVPVARQELMDFFEGECKLTNSEASVRTARIGNRLGWWKTVHERDQSDSANPKRARAITKSVARSRKRR